MIIVGALLGSLTGQCVILCADKEVNARGCNVELNEAVVCKHDLAKIFSITDFEFGRKM